MDKEKFKIHLGQGSLKPGFYLSPFLISLPTNPRLQPPIKQLWIKREPLRFFGKGLFLWLRSWQEEEGVCLSRQQGSGELPALSGSFLASHCLYDNIQMLSLSLGDPNQPWLYPEIRVTSAFSVAIFLALKESDAWLHHRLSVHLRVVYFSVQISYIYGKFIIEPLSVSSAFVI